MEIFVYKGLYNLPSIDFECLRAISFIRLINAPVTIKIDGNPFKSPNGCLPYLKHNGTKIAGFTKIAAFLQDQGFDTTSQNRLSIAYTSYLYDNLYPYMQYFLWGDETNSENTRMLYAKRMIFPLSFCYPQRYAKRVDDLMMSIEQFSLNDKYEDHNVDGAQLKNRIDKEYCVNWAWLPVWQTNAHVTEIIIRAKKCLNTLNEKIGNKPYFFQMSTELDATIYAYLSILYHIPMTKNPVKSHIQECPNLLKFLDKFGKRFFSTELKSYENERPNLSTNDLSNSETKNLSKHGPKILSALFAITVMSVYAIRNGIFSISGRDPMDVTNFDDGDEHEVFDES